MAVARFDMGLTGDDDRKALKKYVLEIDQTVELRQPSDHASTTNPLSNWVRIDSEEHGRSYFFNTLTKESSWSMPRVSDGQQYSDPRVSDGQQLARRWQLKTRERRLQEKERWRLEKERRLQEKEQALHVHGRPAIATERPQFQNKDTGALVAALPSVESWAAQHLPPALTVATTGNNVSSEECVGRLFQAIDADGNGSISLQEIMSWWSQQVQDGVASQASWQRLVSQFGTNPCSRQADSK